MEMKSKAVIDIISDNLCKSSGENFTYNETWVEIILLIPIGSTLP